MFRVLNAYAGIGGNRVEWDSVFRAKGIRKYRITAVEISKEIAEEYQRRFPQDEVVIGDAHEYIEKHFKRFDFIWCSPPCITHSRLNSVYVRYADMRLWQEIIFLRRWCKKIWLVENVIPYYDPLIRPTVKLSRHLFWASFRFGFRIKECEHSIGMGQCLDERRKLSEWLGIPIPKIKGKRVDTILRNCIHPKMGAQILEAALGMPRRPELGTLGTLFD